MDDVLPSGRHASDADQDPTIVDELAAMGAAEERLEHDAHAARTQPYGELGPEPPRFSVRAVRDRAALRAESLL